MGVSQFIDNDQFANFEVCSGDDVLCCQHSTTRLLEQTLTLLDVVDRDRLYSLIEFYFIQSFMLQVGAKECIMADDKSYDFVKMSDVPARCNVPLIIRPRGEFDAKHVEQDIGRLLGR